jgi:hypothetical protein
MIRRALRRTLAGATVAMLIAASGCSSITADAETSDAGAAAASAAPADEISTAWAEFQAFVAEHETVELDEVPLPGPVGRYSRAQVHRLAKMARTLMRDSVDPSLNELPADTATERVLSSLSGVSTSPWIASARSDANGAAWQWRVASQFSPDATLSEARFLDVDWDVQVRHERSTGVRQPFLNVALRAFVATELRKGEARRPIVVMRTFSLGSSRPSDRGWYPGLGVTTGPFGNDDCVFWGETPNSTLVPTSDAKDVRSDLKHLKKMLADETVEYWGFAPSDKDKRRAERACAKGNTDS